MTAQQLYARQGVAEVEALGREVEDEGEGVQRKDGTSGYNVEGSDDDVRHGSCLFGRRVDSAKLGGL